MPTDLADVFPGAAIVPDDLYPTPPETRQEKVDAGTSTVDTVLCPDIEVASWLGLRLHQADFGTGPPSALLKPDMHKEGLIILVPSPMAEGAVDFVVALPEDHVAAFTKICYSLDDTTIFPPSRM
ncbi:tryptamine benzoyltransferase 1-like [Lolium perenne]|uniref:tryptamine benzoyltransferase 1-like n=1 Tax=Lolium perenne TaxID=4522 RepID=UPI003A98FCF6